MTITGTVHRLGDDVDTDAILPGRYLALKDPAALAAYCLEALDPGFRARVRPGDILAAILAAGGLMQKVRTDLARQEHALG